jgi:alpha-beta hydrolase superfamily lysophospholipase
MALFFQNMMYERQATATLGYAFYGGSEPGEVLATVRRIREGDAESWHREWNTTADRLFESAEKSVAAGHRVSARQAYLRACIYYHASFVFLFGTPVDQRLIGAFDKEVEAFEKAAALFESPIEPVEIPYEGSALPAYFVRAEAADERRPTVIVIGGGETFCEELYFWGGAAAAQRGYNALLVDMPGQGATPFESMHHRHDVEVPMGAVLDYLEDRPDVDPERVAAYGLSLGGYIVLRSVSYEGRIKACAVSTPLVDWHQTLLDAMPTVLRRAPRPLFNTVMKLGNLFSRTQLIAYEKFFEWQVGAESFADAMDKFRPWKVDVERISCPVLCMLGTGEQQTFKKQTYACYSALRSPKALRVFTEEEGADAHSQANNQRLAHQVVFDYFDETFARGEANLELRLAEGV